MANFQFANQYQLVPNIPNDNKMQQGMQQMLANKRYAEQQQKQGKAQEALGAMISLRNAPPEQQGEMLKAMIESGLAPKEAAHLVGNPQNLNSAIDMMLSGQFGVNTQQQQTDPRAEQMLKDESEIRKEVRGEARKGRNAISKEMAVTRENFNKLQNLSGQVKKGNRSAVAQSLIALVKLGDPSSIVKESEMVAALNNQSPVAALTDMLASKGIDGGVINSVAAKIDPLNPNNINMNDVLSTAQSMVNANVPSLQNRYTQLKDRSYGNLSDAGYGSIFSDAFDSDVMSLSDLKFTIDEDSKAVTPRAETPRPKPKLDANASMDDKKKRLEELRLKQQGR